MVEARCTRKIIMGGNAPGAIRLLIEPHEENECPDAPTIEYQNENWYIPGSGIRLKWVKRPLQADIAIPPCLCAYPQGVWDYTENLGGGGCPPEVRPLYVPRKMKMEASVALVGDPNAKYGAAALGASGLAAFTNRCINGVFRSNVTDGCFNEGVYRLNPLPGGAQGLSRFIKGAEKSCDALSGDKWRSLPGFRFSPHFMFRLDSEGTHRQRSATAECNTTFTVRSSPCSEFLSFSVTINPRYGGETNSSMFDEFWEYGGHGFAGFPETTYYAIYTGTWSPGPDQAENEIVRFDHITLSKDSEFYLTSSGPPPSGTPQTMMEAVNFIPNFPPTIKISGAA